MKINSTLMVPRFQGWKRLKQTCLVLLAWGSLGFGPLFAADGGAEPPVSSKGEETYDQMFNRMQGKLIALTDKEGNQNPELTLLLLLRPKSAIFHRTDLNPVRIPINTYPFTAKCPCLNTEKEFIPWLSLYDSETIGAAASCFKIEKNWVATAEAMKESVRVLAGIERMLSGTKFSLVALRPIDFYAKDGTKLAALFNKRTGDRSAPETFIYFLDPEKIGTLPVQIPFSHYAHGRNDPQAATDGKVFDLRTSEFVRRLQHEIQLSVQDVSENSGSH